MPSIEWIKLNSPDQNVAWSILAQDINEKFGKVESGNLLAVPSFDQASYYDLIWSVSKKSQAFGSGPLPTGCSDTF